MYIGLAKEMKLSGSIKYYYTSLQMKQESIVFHSSEYRVVFRVVLALNLCRKQLQRNSVATYKKQVSLQGIFRGRLLLLKSTSTLHEKAREEGERESLLF